MPGYVGVVLFALIIFVSVCLHEAGHMLTAKAFGMKVTRYFAGFGPTLWSFRKGETEYGLKAIPLGGFVKIVGMTPQDDDVEPGDEKRAMWRFPVWKRTIVMSAGSVTHFIIGLVLLWITVSFVGITNPKVETWANDPSAAPAYINVQNCVVVKSPGSADCTASDPISPALAVNLKTGDLITAVNGVPTPTYGDLVKQIRGVTDPAVTLAVTHQDHTKAKVPVNLAPVQRPKPGAAADAAPVSTYALGITANPDPALPITVKYGAARGVPETFSYTGNMAVQLGSSFKSLPGKVPGLVKAISGQPRDPNGPISVVGAADIGGQIASRGLWSAFLLLAVTLNFFIGVFNLLPLLPLDGGHIAIAWFERARSWFASKLHRRDPGRVDYNKLMPLTYGVILIFGGFSVLTILADIINPINLFGK
jgi:membrane-associated protease RseP (regulator of RpoE activity)